MEQAAQMIVDVAAECAAKNQPMTGHIDASDLTDAQLDEIIAKVVFKALLRGVTLKGMHCGADIMQRLGGVAPNIGINARREAGKLVVQTEDGGMLKFVFEQ